VLDIEIIYKYIHTLAVTHTHMRVYIPTWLWWGNATMSLKSLWMDQYWWQWYRKTM